MGFSTAYLVRLVINEHETLKRTRKKSKILLQIVKPQLIFEQAIHNLL